MDWMLTDEEIVAKSTDQFEYCELAVEMGCEICGSVESIPLWDVGRWGLHVPNVVCKGCGLIYVDPQPSETERVYRDELPSTETGREVAGFWGGILGVDEDSYVLDVGCGIRGIGSYLEARVLAIDPDPEAIAVSKRKYYETLHICSSFEDFDSYPRRFDFILFIHTLEHLRSPKSALLKARELLKPNGKLAIEVPCTERLYDLPECGEFDGHGLNFFFQKPHLYTFSLKTLNSLLGQTGFMGVRWDFGNHLRCVATKSATNNEIEREDAEIVKERLMKWHNERIR